MPAWLRLVIFALFAALAIALAAVGQRLLAAPPGVLALLMLAAWFRYHDIRRAESAYNARNRTEAWRLLEGIPFGGRLLARECRIYYHNLRARCLLADEEWARAAAEAERAIGAGTSKDQTPGCHVVAAEAYVHVGDTEAARRHADAAKAMPHSEFVDRGLARLAHLLAK